MFSSAEIALLLQALELLATRTIRLQGKADHPALQDAFLTIRNSIVELTTKLEGMK